MDNIQLVDIFFVDKEYSRKHPHMIHRHAEVLELLYIASESGRYLVGNYEYAVTAGDFIICNANIPREHSSRRRSFSRTSYSNLLLGVDGREVGACRR